MRSWRGCAVAVVVAGCASGPPVRAGALPPGCAVEVLHDNPTRPVQSLGEARSRCTGDAMGDVAGCTRALQDQVCGLGGTLLWGVTSSRTDDALLMSGFAGRYR